MSKRHNILVTNILCSIVICIQGISTLMALEKTLRTSVRTVLMSTITACLAGMPRVNLDYLDTIPSCFVGQEAVKLGKRPAMETTFRFHILVLFATPDLGRSTNLIQILKHKGTTLWSVLDNPFGKDVVMVFSLPKPFSRKPFQVPFSRFGSFSLQLAADTKDASLLLLPTSVP